MHAVRALLVGAVVIVLAGCCYDGPNGSIEKATRWWLPEARVGMSGAEARALLARKGFAVNEYDAAERREYWADRGRPLHLGARRVLEGFRLAQGCLVVSKRVMPVVQLDEGGRVIAFEVEEGLEGP